MEFIRRNTNILFVFILPVYLYIVQNSIQNKHTHVYANGIVVTHSHPIENGGDLPISEHDHSKTEICLYSSVHFDFYETAPLSELKIQLNEAQKNYFISNEQAGSSSVFSRTIPRGPPV